MCANELGCVTDAVGMYQSILTEAGQWCPGEPSHLDPEHELRVKLPLMFGQLSPSAQAILQDHLNHLSELVAFVHRVERSQIATA